jgi:hypothetical protein
MARVGSRFRDTMCAVAFGVCLVSVSAKAAPLGAERAEAVPMDVVEVVSGGSWADGSSSGFWRTVTVMTSRPTEASEIYVQWVGSRRPTAPLEILTSSPLREFNELHLSSSSVALDSETEGQVRIVVTGEDASKLPIAMTFIAGLPGKLERVADEPATTSAGK